MFRILLPDNIRIAEALTSLGDCLHYLGRSAEACEMSKEALSIVRSPADSGLHSYLLCHGRNLSYADKMKESVDYLQEDLALLRALSSGDGRFQRDTATCLQLLGSSLLETGREQEAISFFEDSLQLKERLYLVGERDAMEVCRLAVTVGLLYDDKKELNDALRHYKRAFALLKEMMLPFDHQLVSPGNFGGHHQRLLSVCN
eukprot:m.278736 g.278736  ORF g.278736 m.278736 type:complete len:202 (+) comp40611_c0_seq115:4149-4754(+)